MRARWFLQKARIVKRGNTSAFALLFQPPRQVRNLFRAVLAGEQVHWMDGFVLFPSWRVETQKTPYPRLFGAVVAKANRVIKEDLNRPDSKITHQPDQPSIWELRITRSTRSCLKIEELEQRWESAIEAVRRGEANGCDLLFDAHTAWPRPQRLARAVLGSFVPLPSPAEDSDRLRRVVMSLDRYKLALLGAVVKTTLLAQVRELGVEPETARPALKRWREELGATCDAMHLLENNANYAGGNTKIDRFAVLAGEYL